MLYGVDVHDGYQAGLSFPTLARQGYTFAAVKLTQGTGYARDLGDDWVRAARAAGLIPGGYHWLTAGNGAAQARWFHAKVVESGGPDGMLIQLDCEDNAGYADVLDWRDEWNRLTGGHPFLVYTGAWWWQPRGWSGTTVTPHLWHSHYLTADADTVPDDPAAFAARIPASWWVPGYGGWPTATVLQFTSKGDAGGLGNKVDLNVTRMTREQLLALTHPAGAAASTGDDDMASVADTITYEIRPWTAGTLQATGRIEAQLTALLAVVEQLGAAIAKGGGTVDTAAILAGVDERLAHLAEAQTAAVRDAVADGLEGGSAQVRAS